MTAQRRRTEYIKSRLSKDSTSKLLRDIKERSGLTWPELEGHLNIGTGESSPREGGSRPGSTIQQYQQGRRPLSATKASAILATAVGRGWLQHSEVSAFVLELNESNFEKKYKEFERDLLQRIEPLALRIVQLLHTHPDLRAKDQWEAIDKVVAPMMKRLIFQEYTQRKDPISETFVVLLGEEMERLIGGTFVSPEERYGREMDELL